MRYICTHTDFDDSPFVSGTIISSNWLKHEYNLPIIYANNRLNNMQYNYAEGFMIYDIWKNDNNSEFIEINHYRRHFENIETQDCTILPTPLGCNLIKQYQTCHNVIDIVEIMYIIDKYVPEYSLNYQNINVLYPCNMFKMTHEDFNTYCNFIFKALDIYNEHHKFYKQEDIEKYVSKFTNDVIYQSRLQGFLLERLSTIFFLNHFKGKTIKHENIIYTSDKIII